MTASALIANIGNIRRFGSADKLARFAGVTPVRFSSTGKGKDQKSKQGNRELHSILYFLAIQQVQMAKVSESSVTPCSTTTTSERSPRARPRSRPWCA